MLLIAFILSIGLNIGAGILVIRLWQHRRNAILAWAATESWVGEQNRKASSPASGKGNKNNIILLGASITQAFDLDAYFPNHSFINKGINGQLSGQYLLRFKKDVIDYDPDAVVIKLCAINITRDIPLQVSYDNIEMMTLLALANNIIPVLATMIPVTAAFDKKRSPKSITNEIIIFNQWLKKYADDHGLEYLDYCTSLSDEKGYLRPAYSSDGMHLNIKGYDIMAMELARIL